MCCQIIMPTKIFIQSLLIVSLLTSSVMSYGQSPSIDLKDSENKVFIIGDDGGVYERLVAGCPDMLLSVSGNSMEEAYRIWTDMMMEVQKQAEENQFDINGVKIWINVFWHADGSIDKIVYYPKPTSKNLDFEKLTVFLDEFSHNYTLPITFSRCFSHYGSASFPLFMNSEAAADK